MTLTASTCLFLDLNAIVNNNKWLLGVFALYLVFIVLFALIYHFINQRYRQSFAFNADVLRNQVELIRADTKKEIANLILHRESLKELLEQMNAGSASVYEGNAKVIKTANFRFEFTVTESDAYPTATPTSWLDVYDSRGVHKGLDAVTGAGLGDSPESHVGLIEGFLKQKEDSIAKCERRLETLTTAWPEVWSFWDFLYFSVITQTTVGYGDILPNRTLIRLFVSLQVMLGLIMLVVVINLVLKPAYDS